MTRCWLCEEQTDGEDLCDNCSPRVESIMRIIRAALVTFVIGFIVWLGWRP